MNFSFHGWGHRRQRIYPDTARLFDIRNDYRDSDNQVSHLIQISRFLLSALFISATTAVFSTENPRDLLQLSIHNPAELARSSQIVSDFDATSGGVVNVYANAEEQARLRAAGFAFQVKIKNLADYYAQRAAADTANKQTRNRSELTASMGGFRTLAEIETALDWLSATFPDVVSQKFSIGTSVEGRELWVVRISDQPNQYQADEPTVWFDALHHAREAMSGEALLRFAYTLAAQYGADADITRLIDSRNILLLVCANPDGYEYNRRKHPDGGGQWRKNRRDNGDGSFGVDLNRNYSWQWGRDARLPSSSIYQGTAPFSEPETAAIRDFLHQQVPSVYISVHTYGNEWMYPWGWSFQLTPDDAVFRHYAQAATAGNGYTIGTAWDLYGFSYGASDDYHYAEYGSLAYTVEIGSFDDGFWPAPSRIPALFEAVRPAFQSMAQVAGAWPVWGEPQWREQQGNGDAWFDPGEQWLLSLAVENQGALALNGYVSAAGQQTPLSINAREQAVSSPLLIEFPDTPVYPLEVILAYDSVSTKKTLALPLGMAQTAKLGETLHLSVNGPANAPVTLFWSPQVSGARDFPDIEGAVYLTGDIQILTQATTDAAGTTTWMLSIPNDNLLHGQNVYLQALFNNDGKPQTGRLLQVVFE